MADGVFTLTCNEQVTYIKIEARRGKSAIEIQKALEEVGSEFVLPYSSITRWARQFNHRRNTVNNKHLCGRRLLATTGENVVANKRLPHRCLLLTVFRLWLNCLAHRVIELYGSTNSEPTSSSAF